MASFPMSVTGRLNGWTVIALPDERGREAVDHEGRGPVHGNIGDDDDVLRRVGGPFPVGCEDELRSRVERPVARRDDVDGKVLDLIQILPDDRPERHHDLGEISFRRLVDAGLVPDEKLRGREMRAEPVAAEQDPFLLEVGRHRLRPMDPRRVDEPERPVPQGDLLPVGDGPESILGDPEMVDEDALGQRRADELGPGVLRQDVRDPAGMVLLGVMGDEIIERRDVGKVGLELAELRRVDRVEEGRAPRSRARYRRCSSFRPAGG